MVPIGLVMTIGKYVLVFLIYLFVLSVFRALLREMAAERSQPVVAAPAPRRAPAALPVARPAEPSATAPVVPVVAGVATPVAASVATPVAVPASPTSRHAPALVVEASPDSGLVTGTAFPLTAAVTIGRAAQNAVVLSDRYASSNHAIVFLQDGKRILRDRGSTNGTLHNGQPMQGDIELKEGDRITIGTTVFRYV